MYPMFHKRSCLARANALLQGDDDTALKYAALELRFCMEAIAYDKLRAYESRLPPRVLEKWQPPQAMKALEQLEPDAVRSFSLVIRSERGNARSLGNHVALDLKQLTKNYNKLGSYLHAPSPKKQELHPSGPKADEFRKTLSDVAKWLEVAASNAMDCSVAETVVFMCELCGIEIPCGAAGLKGQTECECLNPECQAKYFVYEQEDGQYLRVLQATPFVCTKCQGKMLVQNRSLAIGYAFSCETCGAEYHVENRQWLISADDASAEQSPNEAP
jgi:hypothetical protein